MTNTKAEIHKLSKNTLEKAQQKHPKTQSCSCTNKKQCPLNGQCHNERLIYHANITADIPGYKDKNYLAVFETILKFAMVTKKNCLQNNVIKTIQNHPRSIGKVKRQNETSIIKRNVLRKYVPRLQ